MKKSYLFVVFSCLAVLTKAQLPNLAAVPDSLKKGASVIVHAENINFTVEGLEKATLKSYRLFTVLNEDGNDALLFNEYSSKYLSLEDAEIKVYDASGKQVEKRKKKEMSTTAVGEGLVEDGYVTYYRVKPAAYPVTVEFSVEQKFKSTLSIPDYRFIQSGEAVVQSTYTATLPAGMKLRYKANRCNLAPVVSEGEKGTTYQWTVKNLPPIDYEEGSTARRGRYPFISIVTDQFSHYGFQGDLSSWKSFGGWIKGLYDGLDELPPERQQFFLQLVASAPNEQEKIRRIYQYLQANFRYVSIQLGIGGFRPFSATFTDQKKYGDCKALSNFMKAALKAVGIRSCVAIINAGHNEEPVDAVFPANDFNHVVLCVPGKDSVWLECTSATAEFNRLGTFTENRNALLVTENGGVLVATPTSDPLTNTLTTYTVVTMDNDLSAKSETLMDATGDLGEMMTDLAKETRDVQKQTLVYSFGYKQPDDFIFTGEKTGTHQQTTMKMIVRKLPEFAAGQKYFFNPRLQKIWAGKLPRTEERKQDYYFHFPFVKKDTTVLKLPAGFLPDVLPAEKELNTPYGYYHAKTWYNEAEKAFYTATNLTLKKHKVAAPDFKSVKTFFDEVAQDDTQKIVVKRTETAVEKKAF